MTKAVTADDALPPIDEPERTGVIRWESVPRRIVTIYLPLACFVFVLLFPFYWMAITAVKSNEELYNYKEYNPFWVHSPTLANINRLLFQTDYPQWLMVTMTVAFAATALSLFSSVLAAYAIQRLRFRGSAYVGLAIYLAYLVPPSILFIPLATMVFQLGLFDSPMALILTYPTFLIPFCTWLLMGYFRTVPKEVEECAMVDGATRIQALVRIVLPIAIPGLVCAALFAFTLSWNEFIYALTFTSSSEEITASVGVTSELIRGDIYFWGQLMAGAVLGSVPIVILYVFFLDYYVSGLTAGAVK
jgi:multiple sugar transport system permease protein